MTNREKRYFWMRETLELIADGVVVTDFATNGEMCRAILDKVKEDEKRDADKEKINLIFRGFIARIENFKEEVLEEIEDMLYEPEDTG